MTWRQWLVESALWVVLVLSATLVAIALTGCRNDAITYAKAIAPDAECSAIETYYNSRGYDTAVCRFEHALWMCSAYNVPECKKIRDVPAEAKP